MKVKSKKISFDKLLVEVKPEKKKTPKPSFLFRTLVRIISIFELRKVKFRCEKVNFKKLPKQPCLYLMNHSSFIDLKIASKILYPKKYNIVATADAMLGKEWLMRRLGCVPTNKFVPDVSLVLECIRIIKKKKRSVLLYPEAGYSFDGTSTILPHSLSAFVKKLGVPVVSIITDGAYLYDPLYNELQKRKVKVSAKVKVLFTPEEIKEKSVSQIEERLLDEFSFDNFKNQLENGVKVTEDFRADGLERVLYRCPCCGVEGRTEGKGIKLVCHACGKEYILEENGQMKAVEGVTEFPHIPDWFNYQRECVKKEIEDGTYSLSTEVDIGVIYGYKSFYEVGEGVLTHDLNGLSLRSLDGQITASQPPRYSYSLNADFYWYEGTDIISFGNTEMLYYCFPKTKIPVAKIRIAVEETYKMLKEKTNE